MSLPRSLIRSLREKRAPSGSGCRGSCTGGLRCKSTRHASHLTRASSRLENQNALRHSARTRPLKDPANTLSVGLPLRPAIDRREQVKSLHDVGSAITHPDVERRRHPAEIVDDREHPDLAAIEELVRQASPSSIHWALMPASVTQLGLTFRLGVLLRNCRPVSRYSRCVRLRLIAHPSLRGRTWIRRHPWRTRVAASSLTFICRSAFQPMQCRSTSGQGWPGDQPHA